MIARQIYDFPQASAPTATAVADSHAEFDAAQQLLNKALMSGQLATLFDALPTCPEQVVAAAGYGRAAFLRQATLTRPVSAALRAIPLYTVGEASAGLFDAHHTSSVTAGSPPASGEPQGTSDGTGPSLAFSGARARGASGGGVVAQGRRPSLFDRMLHAVERVLTAVEDVANDVVDTAKDTKAMSDVRPWTPLHNLKHVPCDTCVCTYHQIPSKLPITPI